VPEARVHVVLLKVPVLFVVKVTVPVGVPEVEATVAVHVVAVPTVTEAGLQLTVVVAETIVVTTNVPLLPAFVESPP
jgi:hypothetical protein